MHDRTWAGSLAGLAIAAALIACSDAGREPAGGATAVASPRVYVFDNGTISGLDPGLFNFSADELAEVDFVNASYLVVHPQGTLMFDAGAVPDSAFLEHGGGPVTEGVVTASLPLLPQLAAAGYTPEDVDYFALSHYHSDHTGNANAFAAATWIVQRAERDYMFAADPQGIIDSATYFALEDARTVLLENDDYDVFGDGSVVVMSTPGHTPGHQVLAVRLNNTGTVVLGGDLYHYPEEITTGRTPTFEFDAERSRQSRARIQRFLAEQGATLWIEHDKATHAALPKAPDYVD